MSPETAVAILVETVETATPYVDSIELVGQHDARAVLEALRVVLNDLRERDNTDEGDWEVAPTGDVEESFGLTSKGHKFLDGDDDYDEDEEEADVP